MAKHTTVREKCKQKLTATETCPAVRAGVAGAASLGGVATLWAGHRVVLRLALALAKLDLKPVVDVVDEGRGLADLLVVDEARRLKPRVAELARKGLQRDAVLKGQAGQGADGVHQAADG